MVYLLSPKGSRVLVRQVDVDLKTVSCNTADSKLVKQEVNSTVILPPLVFLALPHSQ
jgi:hypothetical protein